MSSITLRSNKQLPLSYGELDANFTTLGLSHGMDTAANNVAISVDTITATTGNFTTVNSATINETDINVTNKIEVNIPAGNQVSNSVFHSSGPDFTSNILERYVTNEADADKGLVSAWLHTDFSDLSAENNTISNGKGAGFWTQLSVDDGNGSKAPPLYTGGIQFKTREVTDLNNYETHCSIHTYHRENGGGQIASDMLTIGKSETKFENTDRVAMYAPLKVAHYTATEISTLAAHDGTIIFNTTAGEFQGWDGTSWVNLGAASSGTGGTSFDQSLNTTDDVVFNSIETTEFSTTGLGTSEIESATTLTLTSSDGVIVQGGPLRLPTFTTTERNALSAVDGDVILNTTDNAIQARINGNWVNL